MGGGRRLALACQNKKHFPGYDKETALPLLAIVLFQWLNEENRAVKSTFKEIKFSLGGKHLG